MLSERRGVLRENIPKWGMLRENRPRRGVLKRDGEYLGGFAE